MTRPETILAIPFDGRLPLDRLRRYAEEFDAISAEERYAAAAVEFARAGAWADSLAS